MHSDTYEPGTLLNGKYRLDRELGSGGMGAVFAAWNTLLDAPVAIKVLHPTTKPRPDLMRRFMQEARAAAQVRHANIVSVLDIGQDEVTGTLFIVQEFLQGRDLKRHLAASGTIAPRDALELLLPVMRALAFAHSKGVVHRDLKPDNIFLCETSEGIVPKVIDFGIAKMVDDQGQSAQMTRTSQVMGTPYYMCPEQARGDRAVDHRADVWSLGVVLYHMLSGRFPHEGSTTNLIITNIIARMPTPVTAYAPGLPPDVVALVHGALAYEPEQRTPTMDAFWQAARSCLVALGGAVEPAIVAAPPRPSMPVRASSPAQQVTPGTVAPQVLSTAPGVAASRNRSRLWIALGVLVVLSGLGGFLIARKDHHDGPTIAEPASSSRPAATPRPAVATRTETATASAPPAPAPSPLVAPSREPLPTSPIPTVTIVRPPTAPAPRHREREPRIQREPVVRRPPPSPSPPPPTAPNPFY